MALSLNVTVILRSDKKVTFTGIVPGESLSLSSDGVKIDAADGRPWAVTITPPSRNDPVKSVEYDLITDMRNYHKVIIPESGRWFINMTQLVSFWRYKNESSVNDVKMPLYIFTGQNTHTALAFGVIGRAYETSFKTLEPKVNRALIAFMRRLSMQIKRGTDLYPIPDSVALENSDGSITEHLYIATDKESPNTSWLSTLRDFAQHQKRIYALPDVSNRPSMAPLWCCWTDWFSEDVTDEVFLHQVKQGVALGIKNFIIDDGWFGPGLDNDYDVTLNIGDWRPDPTKFRDMPRLVKDIKAAGGVPMIWCAPHAVCPGANCFEERKRFLIEGPDGQPILTPNKFNSLCFMSPEARTVMADICANFITEWDMDGAKYDLFNCVPNIRCCSSTHSHDVSSMVEGLELTLKLIDERCRALKKDYIVELKQNYATPFLSRYGTMTRAGDTPYNTEGNFLRTLYVQGYTPSSINDYQTITSEDSPEEAACIVLKMMAVGIPSYSINFDRLTDANKQTIAHYNTWYNRNVGDFMSYREPIDGENNGFRICGKAQDYFFLINSSVDISIKRRSVILNATFQPHVFVHCDDQCDAKVTIYDCLGKVVATKATLLGGWTRHEVPAGGMMEVRM